MINLNSFHRLRDELLSQLKLNLKIKIFCKGEGSSQNLGSKFFFARSARKIEGLKSHKIQAYLTDKGQSYSLWCSVVTGIRGIR